MGEEGKLVLQVGAVGIGGVGICAAGASTLAISAATVLLATGGGAAVLLAGYGILKLCSNYKKEK